MKRLKNGLDKFLSIGRSASSMPPKSCSIVDRETMIRQNGKEVSLLELFFDLVFVYAMSKITGILETTAEGIITPYTFFIYYVSILVVLQVWLYQTNYNNRFSAGRWYENFIMAANMMSILFVSNILHRTDLQMTNTFNRVMIVMLGGISFLYFMQSRNKGVGSGESRTFSSLIFSFVIIYAVSSGLISSGVGINIAFFITVAGIFTGAFLPAFIRRNFDTSIVDFPHLTERFELLIILSFGEVVISVGEYFLPGKISLASVAVFVVILLLFGSYVIHNHYLIDRETDTRGIVLMFSHYALVISITMMTVGQSFIRHTGMNNKFFTVLILAGVIMFFMALYTNSVYYEHRMWFLGEKLGILIVTSVGGAIMLYVMSGYGCLMGMLVISLGNFGILLYKGRQVSCFLMKV